MSKYLNGAYAVLALFAFLRDNFFPDTWRHTFEFVSFLTRLSLPEWIAILLGLNLVVLLEGAFNNARKNEAELYDLRAEVTRLSAEPSGPEIVIEYDNLRSDDLTVKNLRGGTAYRVILHEFSNSDLVSRDLKIDYLAEGMHLTRDIDVYFKDGWDAGLGLSSLLAAAHTRGLDTNQPVYIRANVTFSDANNRQFEEEFQIRYVHADRTVNVQMLHRRLLTTNSTP